MTEEQESRKVDLPAMGSTRRPVGVDQFGSQQSMPSAGQMGGGLRGGAFNIADMREGFRNTGGITPEDLPEQWGGRPTGTSRRAIRMQKEWDDRRNRQIQEYNIQREAYESDRSFGLQMRDQAIQEADFQMKQEERVADQKIEYERKTQAANISRMVNTIDPKSPTYQDEVARIVAENPMGATDESVAKVLQRYDAVNEIYRNAEKSKVSTSKEADDAIAKAIEAGVPQKDIESARTRNGFDIGMLNQITAAAKYKASEEDIGFKRSEKEDRLRQAAVDAEARAESLKQQFGGDDPRYAEQAARASGARARYEEAAKSSKERETKSKQSIFPKFNSVEEAVAAGLKSGTIVDIGGKKARIN